MADVPLSAATKPISPVLPNARYNHIRYIRFISAARTDGCRRPPSLPENLVVKSADAADGFLFRAWRLSPCRCLFCHFPHPTPSPACEPAFPLLLGPQVTLECWLPPRVKPPQVIRALGRRPIHALRQTPSIVCHEGISSHFANNVAVRISTPIQAIPDAISLGRLRESCGPPQQMCVFHVLSWGFQLGELGFVKRPVVRRVRSVSAPSARSPDMTDFT